MPKFAMIAKPLHNLKPTLEKEDLKCKKRMTGQLWYECKEAFNTLLDALISFPILVFPYFSLPYVLEIDSTFSGFDACCFKTKEVRKKRKNC